MQHHQNFSTGLSTVMDEGTLKILRPRTAETKRSRQVKSWPYLKACEEVFDAFKSNASAQGRKGLR